MRNLGYRRRFGFALANDESTLKNFAAFADHAKFPDRLTAALAGQWARTSKRQSLITWARRIEVLRGFARYWLGSESGTWRERNVPSICRPSTTFVPVQPFGETRTIIGQHGRVASPLVRARCWSGLICAITTSSVAAMASCIGAGS